MTRQTPLSPPPRSRPFSVSHDSTSNIRTHNTTGNANHTYCACPPTASPRNCTQDVVVFTPSPCGFRQLVAFAPPSRTWVPGRGVSINPFSLFALFLCSSPPPWLFSLPHRARVFLDSPNLLSFFFIRIKLGESIPSFPPSEPSWVALLSSIPSCLIQAVRYHVSSVPRDR